MSFSVDNIQSLNELRQFIHKTLCEKENLLEEQFSMTEMSLIRRGRSCGILIWSTFMTHVVNAMPRCIFPIESLWLKKKLPDRWFILRRFASGPRSVLRWWSSVPANELPLWCCHTFPHSDNAGSQSQAWSVFSPPVVPIDKNALLSTV